MLFTIGSHTIMDHEHVLKFISVDAHYMSNLLTPMRWLSGDLD